MSGMQYDVLVVGGGPAGSTVAYELASRKLNVLLLDKAVFPRYKPCAGGVSVRSANCLPFDITPVIERSVYALDVSMNFSRRLLRRAEVPCVHTVRRERFDLFLLEKARRVGAQVVEGTPLIDLDLEGGLPAAVTPAGKVKARAIVGADGAISRVAKSAGLGSSQALDVAVACEHPSAQSERLADDTVRLDWGTIPTGYAWAFPRNDGWSVGAAGSKKLSRLMIPYHQKLIESTPQLLPTPCHLHGHVLPQRDPHKPIQRGSVLLVGDAAGLLDSFTGEGIYYAIRSGQIAAEIMALALESGEVDLQPYQDRVDTELLPELLESRLIALLADSFPWFFYRLFEKEDGAWQMLTDLLRGTVTYGDIRAKIVSSELAWKVMAKVAVHVRRRRIACFAERGAGMLSGFAGLR